MQIRIFLILTLSFSWVKLAVAQVDSPKNRFEVNAIKGCAPLQVTATNTSGLDPSQFPIVWNMDWDGDQTNIVVDPNQSAAQADTTYTTPGIYQILQVIGNQSDPIDTLTIEVLPDNPPDFQVTNCINNSIYIDFSQDTVFDNLVIDFGDGNGTTVPVSSGSVVHQFASGGDYTVSVQGTFDNGGLSCSAFDTTITTIQDLDIAQINIVRVNEPQEIEIAYNLTNPDVYYRLEVAENSSTEFSFASIDLNNQDTVVPFINDALDTRTNYYCFRIVAVNRCDESLSLPSNVACSILLQASAEDLQNRLSWQTEGYNNFSIGRDGEDLSTTPATEYIDSAVVCQEEYLYVVSATSGGATSVSNRLEVTAVSIETPEAPADFNANLSGINARLTWPEVVVAEQYYIYRTEAGGNRALLDSLQPSSSQRYSFTDPAQLQLDVRYCYQLSYLDECGNESELSEQACVVLPRQARIFFPNAFTPDGDGLNDIFVYKASLITSVNFTIYNRWGELLFATEEVGAGWNGTYGASMAPQGTYLFKLEVEDELGNAFSRTGSFKLLR